MSAGKWKKILLERALEVLIDYRGKTPKKTLSGIPLITAKIVKNGFIQEPNEFISEEDYDAWMVRGFPEIGDVVLTMEAPLGEVAQINNAEVALAQRIVTLRGKKGLLDNSYLKYFFKSETGQARLKERETGTTVTGIKQSELRIVEIDVPPFSTQTRIASILSALDEKIELNRQTNATLEAIAQAIFEEWFVNFNFPGATGEMVSVGATGRSPLPAMIPHGWRVGRLSDLVELNPKVLLKKGTIAKYVEMKDLSTDSSSIMGFVYKEFSSGSKFCQADTLLARITPCLENGKTGFVDFLENDKSGWGSTEFIVMRGKGDVSPYYVYCLSRQESFREFAIQSMVGSSGRQRVVESILSDFSVVIPAAGTMTKYHQHAESIFRQKKRYAGQSATLSAIRAALLPKLMSGEIEV
jgi:type I restriction enzyme, S subunit